MSDPQSPVPPDSPDASAGPAVGVPARMAPGVWRVTLPVPFPGLQTVNAYLVESADGWTLVDTGLNTAAARAAWEAAFAALGLAPGDLARIVLTHAHPDHFGLAGWWQTRAAEAGRDVPVHASAASWETIARVWSGVPAQVDELVDFFRRCGVPDPVRAVGPDGFRRVQDATRPHPRPGRPLAAGDVLEAGAYRFVVHATPGHSDDHVVLFDAEAGLLIAGDHVLPTITPAVGRWPASGADPLGRYLASLRALEAWPVRRALPGHGEALDGEGWRTRVRTILAHHDDRLAATRASVARGATVFEASRRLFDHRRLRPDDLGFVVTETLAHLEYLAERGEIDASCERVWRFGPRAA